MPDKNIPKVFRLLLCDMSVENADMTVGDPEFQGTAPFYKDESIIVKRQYALHRNFGFHLPSKQNAINKNS